MVAQPISAVQLGLSAVLFTQTFPFTNINQQNLLLLLNVQNWKEISRL